MRPDFRVFQSGPAFKKGGIYGSPVSSCQSLQAHVFIQTLHVKRRSVAEIHFGVGRIDLFPPTLHGALSEGLPSEPPPLKNDRSSVISILLYRSGKGGHSTGLTCGELNFGAVFSPKFSRSRRPSYRHRRREP